MSIAKILADLRARVAAMPSHVFTWRMDGTEFLERESLLVALTAVEQQAEFEELSKVAADRIANAVPAEVLAENERLSEQVCALEDDHVILTDRAKAHEATIAAQNVAITHLGAVVDDLRKELANTTRQRDDFVKQCAVLREKGRRVPVREMAPATD